MKSIGNNKDTAEVLKTVEELVAKYNSLLRINQLLMEFIHEKHLQDDFLEYLKLQDPLPEKQ